MKIDILSDLHLDFYFNPTVDITTKNVKSFFDSIFTKDDDVDTLIIAGDIGHYNYQNIEVLKIIKKEYYKNIICVLGNHDYFLVNRIAEDDYSCDAFKRVEEMRKLANNLDGVYCLNGNVVDINGITFGGCDSWYDGKYYNETLNQQPVSDYWRETMNDANYILGINTFNDLYEIERKKIEEVYQECDVMITHVNPSYLHKHIAPTYKNDENNMFFTFDGHRFMKDGSMKYWVFGHTHDTLEYEHHGVKCICNPLGYPYENKNIKMKSIEI